MAGQYREMARTTGISKNTVKRYLRRIAEHGYTAEGALMLDDKTLAQIVERIPSEGETERFKVLEKRFALMVDELRRVGVTHKKNNFPL
jgi:hypothetical protein